MNEREPNFTQKGLNLRVWKRILPYLAIMKKPFTVVVSLMIVSALSESTYSLFISYAVNNFVAAGTAEGIPLFAACYGGMILLGSTAVVIYCRSAMVVEMQIGRHLKRDCFIHLQQLPISYYNTTSVGYILARVMSDTNRISGVIAWAIIGMGWETVYVLGALIAMFILDVKLALLLAAIIPVVIFVSYFFNRKILVAGRRIRAINSRIIGAYNEDITGAKTSKSLVIEDKNCREMYDMTSEMYRATMKSEMLSAIYIPLIVFCGSMAVAIVLYRGGQLVMDELLDWGILSAFISYAVSIMTPLQNIARTFTDVIAAQASIERVAHLLDEPVTIKDTKEVIEKYGDSFEPKRENWEPISGEIEFKNVNFHYPDSDEMVLEDFSLKIPAGTNVAIVGETGAGKSTLVNMVCRFFEPTQGRILIDGRDYRERSQLWLHSSLGYVLQNPHLFSGTIADNIRYGKLEASDEDVRRAAALVSLDKIVEAMPDGYDTDVGEGGDKLSTGEKQLVAFARAMLADPPIFILDEATASIDTEMEQLIQNAISNVLTGRTSLIIAHRLSTIRHADIILVVHDGRIIERGTHDELMALGGRYHELYMALSIEE